MWRSVNKLSAVILTEFTFSFVSVRCVCSIPPPPPPLPQSFATAAHATPPSLLSTTTATTSITKACTLPARCDDGQVHGQICQQRRIRILFEAVTKVSELHLEGVTECVCVCVCVPSYYLFSCLSVYVSCGLLPVCTNSCVCVCNNNNNNKRFIRDKLQLKGWKCNK